MNPKASLAKLRRPCRRMVAWRPFKATASVNGSDAREIGKLEGR
jgi:hypothetical protein